MAREQEQTGNVRFVEGDSKDRLIEQLMLECDARHAHEDALESQVRSLGAEPVSGTWLDPSLKDQAREFESNMQQRNQEI